MREGDGQDGNARQTQRACHVSCAELSQLPGKGVVSFCNMRILATGVESARGLG